MAGESYQKIEVALDAGMVSNQAPAKGDPGTLLEAANVRHASGPAGTVERQPGSDQLTSIGSSGVPVSLIPLGGEVALVSKAHVEAHGAGSGTLWRQESRASTSHPGQGWTPLTATGGGTAWSAEPNETPMAAEFCQRAGVLVGALTYLEKYESYPFASAPRSEYIRTVLRVLDPETGSPLIQDVTLASAPSSAAAPNTNSVLGAVPITDALGTATQVAVWWCEYSESGLTWTYKYRVVTVASDGGATVSGLRIAWTDDVSADVNRTSLGVVTQSCEGPTRYTYVGRRNAISGEAELLRWDCVTHAQSWSIKASTGNLVGGQRPGYGYYGFGGPHNPLDVAATSDYVGMAYRYDEGGGLTESVRVLSATEAGVISLNEVRVLPTTTTSGIDFYYRLGITHHSETAGESWVVTATHDGHLTTISNQLPTATPHQFCVVSGLVSGGVATLGTQVRFHAHTSERPFTAWDASATATRRAVPYVPIMRSARGYHATENPLGQQGLVAPQNNFGSIEPDPALEIHTAHIIDQSGSDRARLQPACRVGVGRTIPASTTHSGGDREPGRDHRRAKPLSDDGETFVVPYLADRDAFNNTPRSVRYAILDAGHAPRYAETPLGVTYVAAGTVFTWDGTYMLESTPISLPRLRAEEFDTGADALKFQAGATYYFNAIYTFRDDAGVIHRSQPYPQNLEVTIGGTDARLKIFVEQPPTSMDGVGLQFIGAEIYGATNALALVKGMGYESGMPVASVNEVVGELEYRLRGPAVEFAATNTAAYWQGGAGGEVLPDCPASMLDIEYVNDRLWGIRGEDRVPVYTKPFVEGRTLEWSVLQDVKMQSETRPTAVSQLDERVLIFTARDAWTLFGEGPNANLNGAFSIPQRVAGVGATDARLVLKTPRGVVFKSESGWFRLGAGYELSVWGEEVRDLLEEAYCLTLWRDAHEVRVGRRDANGNANTVLVWNWLADKWSVISAVSGGTYSRDILAAGSNLYGLTSNSIDHHFTVTESNQSVKLTTPWLRPAGLDGDARVLECVFTARRLLSHGVQITVWADYNEIDTDVFTWTAGEVDASGPASGGHYSLQFTLPSPSARAFKFRIEEQSGAAGAAAFHPLALTLAVKVKPNLWQQYLGKK